MNMDYSKAFELLNQDAEKERNKKAEKTVHDNLYNKGFRDGLAVLDKMREDMLYEIYMAGTNMAGEYKGCWVRFKNIEKIVNEHFKAALETKESEDKDGKEH